MIHYFDVEHSLAYGSFPFEKLSESGIHAVLLQTKGMKQSIRIFVADEGEEIKEEPKKKGFFCGLFG